MYETSRNSFIKMGLFGRIYHCLSGIFCILHSYIMNIALVGAICLPFFSTRAYANESSADGQNRTEVVALKNNLLYDAAATPNLQLEIKLAPKWTLELGAGFNPFPLNDRTFPKWRHVSASIAPRYWFCNAFYGGFISFNAAYAHYNVAGGVYPIGWMYNQVKDNRYQGDAVMGGVSGGWHFAISPHFSIELEGGIEAGYSWYDRFECKHCGIKTESGGRWMLLPKLGINLVVPLGGDRQSFEKRCDCEKPLEPLEPLLLPNDTIALPKDTTAMPNDTVSLSNDTTSLSNDTTSLSNDTTSLPKEVRRAPEQTPETPAEVHEAPAEVVPVVAAPVVAAQESVQEPTPEPEVVKKGEPKERMCDCMLRPGEPYRKYDIKTPLSSDSRNVFLYFEVYDTRVDREFLENNRSMDSLMHILTKVLSNPALRLERIQVVGFASFDAPLAFNERLARQRALSIKSYIQSKYGLTDDQFIICDGGESWVEMRYMLEDEQFEGQAEMFRIIDEEPDLDKREALIKKLNGGETYRLLKTEYRKILRNLGCITIYYESAEK